MGKKRVVKTYILESANERVFDEFATLANHQHEHRAEKRLVHIAERPDGDPPQEKYPVALVFEVSVHEEPTTRQGSRGGVEPPYTYAVPLLGHSLLQQLEGRMLDYVDATYADKEQRDAQKRIIRRVLHEFRNLAAKHNEDKFEHAVEEKDDTN